MTDFGGITSCVLKMTFSILHHLSTIVSTAFLLFSKVAPPQAPTGWICQSSVRKSIQNVKPLLNANNGIYFYLHSIKSESNKTYFYAFDVAAWLYLNLLYFG